MGLRATLRRWVLVLAALSAFWALVLRLVGGVTLRIGPVRFSSHSATNPFLTAVAALGIAWVLTPSGERGQWLRQLDPRNAPGQPDHPRIQGNIHRRAQMFAWCAAVLVAAAVLYVGLAWGALVAGGSDSFGYLSQARLWSRVDLTIEEPLLETPPGGNPKEVLVPLGYRLGPARDRIVPIYSPGFPMTLAVAESIAGPEAVFYVLPLLAALATLATFSLGSTLFEWRVGLTAAGLLATSPAFVFPLTHAPMSDLPATAWWAIGLALAVRDSRLSAFLAGLAASAAILTRPNLMLLGLVVGAFIVWRARYEQESRGGLARLLSFAGGMLPGLVTVAATNSYWYGSPFESGYGPLLGTYFRWEHFPANAAHYPRWLWQTEGPFVLCAFVLPLLHWRDLRLHLSSIKKSVEIGMLFVFVASTCLGYLFYVPYDAWWNLRFLLPAFPPLLVLAAAAFFALGRLAPPPLRHSLAPLIAIVTILYALAFSRMERAYDSTDEWRFATMGRFLRESTPERAVFVSMLHSGSARYYSNRLTLRWDMIPSTLLEATFLDLQNRGYVPYVLVDGTEVESFTEVFTRKGRLAPKDWVPLVAIDGVRLYGPIGLIGVEP